MRAPLLAAFAAIAASEPASPMHDEIEDFRSAAASKRMDRVLDHQYSPMYGTFIMPMAKRRGKRPVKLFEIGIGCHGGSSTHARAWGGNTELWPQLLPDAEIWMADLMQACAQSAMRRNGRIRTVFGDQGDPAVLRRWVVEANALPPSGQPFDVIIDDGGHKNQQIKLTFDHLWPVLAPGGLYFMEDLQVGRKRAFSDHSTESFKYPPIAELMEAWTEQLILANTFKWSEQMPKWKEHPEVYVLPANVSFVHCQREACVIGKSL